MDVEGDWRRRWLGSERPNLWEGWLARGRTWRECPYTRPLWRRERRSGYGWTHHLEQIV